MSFIPIFTWIDMGSAELKFAYISKFFFYLIRKHSFWKWFLTLSLLIIHDPKDSHYKLFTFDTEGLLFP